MHVILDCMGGLTIQSVAQGHSLQKCLWEPLLNERSSEAASDRVSAKVMVID
jgi:hypothetical protein